MRRDDNPTCPSPARLLAVIRMQTEIAKMGLDLHGVINLVAQQALALIGASGAVVELAEGEEMVYRAVAGAAQELLGLRLQRGNSLSGLCVTTNVVLRCDDSETDERVDREACREVGLRSMIAAPLLHLDQAVGVLKVFSSAPHAFGDGEVQLIELMAETIAAAMYHSAQYGADELFRRATTDPLTGLANRAFFFDRLRRDLARAKRDGSGLGVLMIDINDLKPINDQYGHRAGDAAIREVAERMAAEARQSDTVARIGGDEFAIVLTPLGQHQDAQAVANRIIARCDRSFFFEGHALPLSVSIGTAFYPQDGSQADALLEMADQAMYCRKKQSKE